MISDRHFRCRVQKPKTEIVTHMHSLDSHSRPERGQEAKYNTFKMPHQGTRKEQIRLMEIKNLAKRDQKGKVVQDQSKISKQEQRKEGFHEKLNNVKTKAARENNKSYGRR